MNTEYDRDKTFICLSTHGGAGYAPGTHWSEDGKALICGLCGARIENPRPVGERDGIPYYGDSAGFQPGILQVSSQIRIEEITTKVWDTIAESTEKAWDAIKSKVLGPFTFIRWIINHHKRN
jgi:hypothetical protein